MALINGKIQLTEELPFDYVEDFLLKEGYSWRCPGKLNRSIWDTDINALFFYKKGSMFFCYIEPGEKFWLKHQNPTYTIKDGELVIVDDEA